MASNIVTNFAAFVLVLGFLIFAHEAGHFVFAKIFKVKVLIFSLGFGKRLFGFRRAETDYRVSLIPLGGYVRMAGDNPEEQNESQPGDFLAKPKWQRFLILLAGPAVNVLIAIAFLTGLNMSPTEVTRDFPAIIGSVIEGKPAEAAGLLVGDRVIEANGEKIETWDDFRIAVAVRPGTPINLTLIRDGQTRTAVMTPERELTDYGSAGRAGVGPFIETEIGRILPGSAAERAGLRRGDRIVEAGGAPIQQWWPDLETALEAAKKEGATIAVLRNGERISLDLPGAASEEEIYPGFIPPTEIRQYAFPEAFAESIRQNVRMVQLVGFTLGRLFKAEGSVKDFSGPISIARISGDMLRTGWQAVIFLMASISLQLGILNLLPIPVLDGGHIFILGVEGIARRDLSLRVKERIQQVGFALLVTLMLVVLFNDVIQNVTLMRRG
ncbi:MAG TPA: RIP metalloprotease RseP [Thermoanaerobaculia bacterium]|nr:RIP metalloprotease RseP [Thermoanaerobaculia bacterium]